MIKFERFINCIDAHTAGEPLRIVTSGFPPIKGKTILEKRSYVKQNYNDIRKMIMLEPRGHSGMYGCIMTEAVSEDGDFGVLFTHNDGLSTMCGHGIIAVTKVALETGIINLQGEDTEVRIDTPAGRVTAYARMKDGYVENVRFNNVPSFVYREDMEIELADIGKITVDISFSGAFYVYVRASELNLKLDADHIDELVDLGMKIKYKVMDILEVEHPIEKRLKGIYGTIITDPLKRKENRVISKNVCIFADGQIDRSPTGTGTGARVALLKKKGKMKKDDILVNRSIIDTEFSGKIVKETEIADYRGIIPQIKGDAHIMGFNQLVLDPRDPLPEGFRIIGG